MKLNSRLDRSVLLAELEAEQRRNEAIIFSAVMHILLVIVAINFHTIEKWLHLNKPTQLGNTSEKVEISLIEVGSQQGTTGAVMQPEAQIVNEASHVATAPEIQKVSEQSSVQNTVMDKNDIQLSQAQPTAVKLAVDRQAELNQKTKKEKETAAITQAEIEMKRMRERQLQIQREIDESLKARQEQERKQEAANQQIANLMPVESDDKAHVRGPAEAGPHSGESGVAFMDAETFQNFQAQLAKGAPQTGSSQFVVNIKQLSKNTEGQEPCPENRTYHNPADECRPYTQKLYKPLCLYEYNECLELMKKMKPDAGDTVGEN